jgi:hypothetical protein
MHSGLPDSLAKSPRSPQVRLFAPRALSTAPPEDATLM